jgi:hypothetical protein
MSDVVISSEMQVFDESDMKEIYPEIYEQQQLLGRRIEEAKKKGRPALERLLTLAETGSGGQVFRVALFLGACWNGSRHFNFYDFRGFDMHIGDDMMAVLEWHRLGNADIENMLPDANSRIVGVLTTWGMYGIGQTGQQMA